MAVSRYFFDWLRSFGGTFADLGSQKGDGLAECGGQRVIPAFGENIGTWRHQMHMNLVRRAGVGKTNKPDVRFIDLSRVAEREELLFHPGIEFLG